ncbi:MAG: HisA/HisF-related TIM barrel protein [Hydrotalea sp.]|nr:HisA/HisF-related TIM barrel protein [Hydrotalea sp.]
MSEFIIYPAIDMKGGKVVRLLKGDMAKATEYGDDPLAQAQQFYAAGAKWIHLVNLDGAVGDENQRTTEIPNNTARAIRVNDVGLYNQEAIDKIISWRTKEQSQVSFQVGGGIKRYEDLQWFFSRNEGLTNKWDRIIVGTMAVKDPDGIKELLLDLYPKELKNRIVIGLDSRHGKIAVRGWEEQTDIDFIELALKFADLPIAAFIHTDIARDGTGAGANWQESKKLVEALREKNCNIPVIVSGGIDSLAEIKSIKATGLFGGVIVGRAIYENKINLQELFALQATA